MDMPSARGTHAGFAATVYERKRRRGRGPRTYVGEVSTDGAWVLHVMGEPGEWRVTAYRSALVTMELDKNSALTIRGSEGAERALDNAVERLQQHLR